MSTTDRYSSDEHIRKARNNRSFANAIKTDVPTLREWRVTVSFYSALHFVQAWLSYRGVFPENHGERSRCIMGDNSLASIWRTYRDLSDLAHKARYTVVPVTDRDVADATQNLDTIASHVSKLFEF